MIPLGSKAPAFSCRTTMGERSLADYQGRWLVFFSHPADFTPVCTSEFLAFARAHDEFRAEGCDLLALSVDSLFSHMAWSRSIRDRFGVRLEFPIAEDPSMAIAQAYGMIDESAPSSATVRANFIIDPQGIVRAMAWYPMSTGRNVEEILRTLRALRLSDNHGVVTPESWGPGEPVIEPPELQDLMQDSMPTTDWLYRTRDLEGAQ